jgi:hypothetical protein
MATFTHSWRDQKRNQLKTTYMGINIYHADINSSGIRYNALTPAGWLKADTLAGIKTLIKEVECPGHSGKKNTGK